MAVDYSKGSGQQAVDKKPTVLPAVVDGQPTAEQGGTAVVRSHAIFLALLTGEVAKRGVRDYDPTTGGTTVKNRIANLIKVSKAIVQELGG